MQIALCDDDSVQLRFTQKLIEESIPDLPLAICSFSSAEDLLRRIAKKQYAPEIAILDIDMGGMNGIDLARELNQKLPTCSIIFLTGYVEYCSAVYETDHIFFILKDNAEKYLPDALKKAAQSFHRWEDQSLLLTSSGKTTSIPLSEVRYLESSLRKLIIHTENQTYEVYAQLDHFLSEEQSRNFVRCHKSYLVSLNWITGIDSSSLLLADGERLPISRVHQKEVKKRFFNFHMGPTSLLAGGVDGTYEL